MGERYIARFCEVCETVKEVAPSGTLSCGCVDKSKKFLGKSEKYFPVPFLTYKADIQQEARDFAHKWESYPKNKKLIDREIASNG